MPDVWQDWIPGVLANHQILKLIEDGLLDGVPRDQTPDASAIDLHLADTCYEMKGGSRKPFGSGFGDQIRGSGAVPILKEADGTWKLSPKHTYVFELREALVGLNKRPIWGQATAKSSVGRVDVLARLVVDGMKQYERFDPDQIGERAPMYLEVTPITFGVQVRPGDSLTQLRLFYGDPRACELRGKEIWRTCLDTDEPYLTVDLTPEEIVGIQGCGFRAAPEDPAHFVPLWLEKSRALTDPATCWELVTATKDRRVAVEVNQFYILRSKERLRVHEDVAVYARAIDEEIGEMRIHYAGFAHPGFGWKRNDGKRGTPLIFEVRGHSVPVSLCDGEVLARLQFFRMSSTPDVATLLDTSYGGQELKLSKYFQEWTSEPRRASE